MHEEEENEVTPDGVRLEAVTDFLPFLRAGYWKGVHVASLVPKEKRTIKVQEDVANGPPGGRSGPAGAMFSGGGNSYGSGRSGGYGGASSGSSGGGGYAMGSGG